ncbi:uncharacterized protein MKZ38_008110 [Zalerion maritima]|uniref:3-carboxymuconate cyclase n=1 Tax=Zalerion maritima TaxID=339359 RepID=A0AAD5WTG7_9PEZI|nr:uncharacterized protein MKZ38_008110 [Zalerion maritima]
MKSLILSILASVPLVAAAPRGCVAGTEPQASTGQAVYFITNGVEENAVVAVPIGADGTLSGGTTTGTGGQGSVAVDADGQPAVPDALVGQSALSLAGMNIFAVNAGSNTLSMLSISADDPTQLALVGNPVDIPGEFPNTVSASEENKLVCVGTTGAVAGISCASFDDETGLGEMDGLRAIDLGQTTPPLGPLNTVSQVFFSEAQDSLLVTVKGDPNVNNTGFLSVFPVEQDCGASAGNASAVGLKPRGRGRGKGKGNGRHQVDGPEGGAGGAAVDMVAVLSQTDVRSSPDGTAVLFGSLPIPGTNNRVFATDASFGATILEVGADDSASLVASQAIDGQSATCWVTISELTGTAFVTDVGVNRVVEMSLEDASIINILDLSENGNPGLIDLRAVGGFMYALSPGDGAEVGPRISVLDISGGEGTATEVQNFDASALTGAEAMGMAVLE